MIVCAAECRDGFPDHGSYQEVLSSASSPEALLAEIGDRPKTVPDQWQVQVQAKIQTRARVVVRSGYLGPEQLAAAHLGYTDDVADRGPGRARRRRPARRGSASCRRARRRSRTLQPDLSSHKFALLAHTVCPQSTLMRQWQPQWHAFQNRGTVERRRQDRGATGVGTG